MLRLAELDTPQPGDGEVLIRVTRAGLNFADTHTRTNSYLAQAALPLVPGGEVAGVREDTGERVVALGGTGGYAEYRDGAGGADLPIRTRRHCWSPGSAPGADGVAPRGTSARSRSAVEVRGPARARSRASTAKWARVALLASPPPRPSARWRSSCADAAIDRPRRDEGARIKGGPTAAQRSTSCSRWRAARCLSSRSPRSRRSAGWSPTGSPRRRPTRYGPAR